MMEIILKMLIIFQKQKVRILKLLVSLLNLAIERRVIELENKLDSIDQRYSYVQSSSLFAQHEGFKPEIQFKNEIEQLTYF